MHLLMHAVILCNNRAISQPRSLHYTVDTLSCREATGGHQAHRRLSGAHI